MSLTHLLHKGQPAISLESGSLRATFLPYDGGKMASLIRLSDEKELLAVREGDAYRPLTYDGSYVDAECSGFDDMFPTIDPYVYDGISYPDHGEVCRIPHFASVEGDTFVLRSASRRFPFRYEKRVSAEGDSLLLSYRYVNDGSKALPFLWAGHVMLRGEDGMRLSTPFSADAPKKTVFAPEGTDASLLPCDRLSGFVPSTGAAYKFYYTEPIPEGSFSILYENGARLSFSYDKEKLPYLGVWLNNGAFQNLYTLTPEPSTVPFDVPAKGDCRGPVLPPHGEFSFTLRITSHID